MVQWTNDNGEKEKLHFEIHYVAVVMGSQPNSFMSLLTSSPSLNPLFISARKGRKER